MLHFMTRNVTEQRNAHSVTRPALDQSYIANAHMEELAERGLQ